MLDLTRLTPAPWAWHGPDDPGIEFGATCVCNVQCHGNVKTIAREREQFSHADAEFIALAHAAFDVMRRREWGVRLADSCPVAGRIVLQWQAIENRGGTVVGINGMIWADDPFTALVKADAWYKANVENAGANR